MTMVNGATFSSTPGGQATRDALNAKELDVRAAARAGKPPVLVIASSIKDHLGDRNKNSMVGRMIRERAFGTESGAVYALRPSPSPSDDGDLA